MRRSLSCSKPIGASMAPGVLTSIVASEMCLNKSGNVKDYKLPNWRMRERLPAKQRGFGQHVSRAEVLNTREPAAIGTALPYCCYIRFLLLLQAYIRVGGKHVHLGCHETEVAAAQAFDQAAIVRHSHTAGLLNLKPHLLTNFSPAFYQASALLLHAKSAGETITARQRVAVLRICATVHIIDLCCHWWERAVRKECVCMKHVGSQCVVLSV